MSVIRGSCHPGRNTYEMWHSYQRSSVWDELQTSIFSLLDAVCICNADERGVIAKEWKIRPFHSCTLLPPASRIRPRRDGPRSRHVPSGMENTLLYKVDTLSFLVCAIAPTADLAPNSAHPSASRCSGSSIMMWILKNGQPLFLTLAVRKISADMAGSGERY
jgi:hypothetical protein